MPIERGFAMRRPGVSRALVLEGSRHPSSREQVRRAAARGLATFYLQEDPATDARTGLEAAAALQARGWAGLATPGTCPPGVARRLAALARRMISGNLVDGLVIFGGDTTLAVLEAIGAAVVEPCGELLPGIPLSVVPYQNRRLTLVTKAGGFGAGETLCSIQERLEKEQ